MHVLALLWVVGLAALCGYVWLVALAFRRSTAWGLLVLLLSPFSAAAFAIGHWKRAQTPFIFHAGGLVAMLLLFLIFAGPSDVERLAEVDGKQPRREPAAALRTAEPLPASLHGGDPPTPAVDLEGAREPPAEAAEIASAPNAPQPSRITPALSAQAARKIGAPQREPDPPLGVWVEIVDTNDRLHMGTLLIAGGEEIVIRRPLQGGSASYAIPRREVVSIYARGWRR